MYRDNYVFTADLAAFLECQDLPPSLFPFVRSACWRDGVKVERDTRLIILSVREAPDACHAIIGHDGMTIEEVEEKIRKDLEVVRLSEEAHQTLKELLAKSQMGELVYFLSYEPGTARTALSCPLSR